MYLHNILFSVHNCKKINEIPEKNISKIYPDDVISVGDVGVLAEVLVLGRGEVVGR